jgi:hypothetical protein
MCEEQMALSALNETLQNLKKRYIFHSKVCKSGYKAMECKTNKYNKTHITMNINKNDICLCDKI